MDTEFIRATKERVHFIEVALFDIENITINDYHIDARLNGWEHRYFTRALNGHYGERTQAVFEAVDVLHSGKFNRRLVNDFCKRNDIDYKYSKLRDVYQLEAPLEDSILYAWDVSNDKDLFEIINVENVQLVDVQALWKEKFGGNQLSLIDAYKHVLFNKKIQDENRLIEYAHYACCDVMLLNRVVKFIETYTGELKVIPVEKSVRDKKLAENADNIDRWKQSLIDIDKNLEQATDSDELIKLSKKQIRQKKKIAKASRNMQKLELVEVYEVPWWE